MTSMVPFTTTETVIDQFPPSDGREWDCQCARCGSSFFYDPYDRCGEDYHGCLSSPDWCNAHPLEGREKIERGEIEWFVLPDGEHE